MPLQDFPNIVRWLDGLNRLPAWSNPWPETRQALAA
jgi:glutathione S-transferase